MKITTYNMRRGGAGRTHWSRILADHDPDVLLAQETYAPQEHLSPSKHGDLHQHAVWAKVATVPWGSAVYVKSVIPRPITIPVSDFAGWVVGGEVTDFAWSKSGAPKVQIFSVHAPKIASYQKAINSILDMISGLTDGCDLVIAGDFNLTVSERQATEPLETLRDDRAIQARLRDEFGLVNCWQTTHPGEPLPQTLRWENAPETPYHCDGIFVPKSWACRLRSCKVLSDGAWADLSDHNPVAAEFE
jgi:endonuclease/exonuclease/phosphatase family metal-dependent hydrolase